MDLCVLIALGLSCWLHKLSVSWGSGPVSWTEAGHELVNAIQLMFSDFNSGIHAAIGFNQNPNVTIKCVGN